MMRTPIVAGVFYEASAQACRQEAQDLLDQAQLPGDLPEKAYGGIVPHAGWVCSGAVAAMTFKALHQRWHGSTVVLLGAVHAFTDARGMLYAQGSWQSPLGEVAVDTELAQAVLAKCPDIREDPVAHTAEHSLEVQLPFIQLCWPGAKILPINVPPSALASGIGAQLGSALVELGADTIVIGSTDLTHYGPRYGTTPAGTGKKGIEWANENDRRLLDMVQAMAAEQIVDETTEHLSACGGGAIAAAIAASRTLGAARGIVLSHTNSYDILRDTYRGSMQDSVGYASVLFA